MNLYFAITTLLHFLVDDQQLTKFESMTTTNMVMRTATHRVTVTVEMLPQTVTVNGFGSITNVMGGDTITWTPKFTNVGGVYIPLIR